jgi:hypothetical protein
MHRCMPQGHDNYRRRRESGYVVSRYMFHVVSLVIRREPWLDSVTIWNAGQI